MYAGGFAAQHWKPDSGYEFQIEAHGLKTLHTAGGLINVASQHSIANSFVKLADIL